VAGAETHRALLLSRSKDFSLLSEYEKFWKITEIFKEWSSGVKTHRDHFVVGFTKEEIIQG